MIAIANILVPTDFSDPAAAALRYARTLAAEFGSRVHLLHVVGTPQIGWASDIGSLSWPELLVELETDARAQLHALVPADDPLAPRVTVATAIGVPVERILEYAANEHIDLIVMGTHGRGLVGHMLLGSVAERVVRRSSVPVLTVHGAPAAAQPVLAAEPAAVIAAPA